jgi:AraC-like DNA-binding protein
MKRAGLLDPPLAKGGIGGLLCGDATVRRSSRSIHGIIAGVRLQRAKRLLAENDLRLSAIAQRTGYSRVEYLCAAFRQAVG